MINLITAFLYYSVLISVCYCAFSSVCTSARRYSGSGNPLEMLQNFMPNCTSTGRSQSRQSRGARRRGRPRQTFDICSFIQSCMNYRCSTEPQQGPSSSTVKSRGGRHKRMSSCCSQVSLQKQTAIATAPPPQTRQRCKPKTENVLTIKITCEQPCPPPPPPPPPVQKVTSSTKIRRSCQSLPNCFQLVPMKCPPKGMISACCIDCDRQSISSGKKRSEKSKCKNKFLTSKCSKKSVCSSTPVQSSVKGCFEACEGVKVNYGHSKCEKKKKKKCCTKSEKKQICENCQGVPKSEATVEKKSTVENKQQTNACTDGCQIVSNEPKSECKKSICCKKSTCCKKNKSKCSIDCKGTKANEPKVVVEKSRCNKDCSGTDANFKRHNQEESKAAQPAQPASTSTKSCADNCKGQKSEKASKKCCKKGDKKSKIPCHSECTGVQALLQKDKPNN